MSTITRIQKEDLGSVSFSAENTHSKKETQTDLVRRLKEATSLGNLERGKVHIRFLTTTGICEVHTTIWHADDEHIVLKGGTSIPVRSIVDVSL